MGLGKTQIRRDGTILNLVNIRGSQVPKCLPHTWGTVPLEYKYRNPSIVVKITLNPSGKHIPSSWEKVTLPVRYKNTITKAKLSI